MAVLETKIHDAANDYCAQVVVEEYCRRNKFRQDLDKVESIGIGDQGAINEVLYLPVSKESPDATVFALYLVASGMSRPVHPATPKIFKADVYASIEPIQRRVQR